MLGVPTGLAGFEAEAGRGGKDPCVSRIIRAAAAELDEELAPFGQVAGLEAPGFVAVAGIVAVEIPVGRPVLAIVFADPAFGLRRKIKDEAAGDGAGAVEILLVAAGGVSGEERFDRVHIGVLAAIGEELAGGVAFIAEESFTGEIEVELHFSVAALQQFGSAEAGALAPCGGEEIEGGAVATGSFNAVAIGLDHPGPISFGRAVLEPFGVEAAGERDVGGALPAQPGAAEVDAEAGRADEVAAGIRKDASLVVDGLREGAAGVGGGDLAVEVEDAVSVRVELTAWDHGIS